MRRHRRRSSSALGRLVFATAAATSAAIASGAELYWDTNGAQAAGAGTSPGGSWAAASWNDQSDGGNGGGVGVVGPWVGGSIAVFCAGADAVGSYTVSVSAVQQVGGIKVEEGNLSLSGGGAIDLGGANVPMDVSGGAGASVSSVVSGAGVRLVKDGAGTLVLGTVLNTFNTFDGGVSVAGGVLEFPGEVNAAGGQSNALGKAPASFVSDYVRLSGGGTLRSTRVSTGAANVLIPNRGIQLVGGAGGALEVADATPNNSLVYAGVISGTGPLTKSGPGTIQLQGTNTYSGDTLVTSGGLGLNATATLGNPTGILHLDGAGAALVAFATRTDGAALPNPIAIAADAVMRNTSTHTSGVRALPLSGGVSATSGASLTIRNIGGGSASFDVRVLSDGFDFVRPVVIDHGTGANTSAKLGVVGSGSAQAATTFSGGISGNGDVAKDGPGTLVLAGSANTYSGATIVSDGNVIVRGSLTHTASLAIQNDAVVQLATSGNGTNVVRAGAISIDPAAKLDVTDNKLITADAVGAAAFDGTYDGVSGLIQAGRIGSSLISGAVTAVGAAEAQQVKSLPDPAQTAIWAGHTVTGSDTLVMYTYGGDATLDGKINVDDYGRIDLNAPLPGVSGWFNGDFNYDGKINVDDYGIIDFDVAVQGPPFSTIRAVPEPSVPGMVIGVMAITMARGRRRHYPV
jgi:fibronectin-binding autotransporter adhesin